MNLRRVFKSIRARITFWHLGVLTLTILVFMIFSQVFLWKQLRIELKAGLRDDVEMVERFLEAGSGGEIVWSGHEMGAQAPAEDHRADADHLGGPPGREACHRKSG